MEYSLRSLGLSAEEMRDALGGGGRQLLPTESVAIEAMAEMMTNLGGMRSRLCKENSSSMRLLCGSDKGVLGEDLVKVIRNALS